MCWQHWPDTTIYNSNGWLYGWFYINCILLNVIYTYKMDIDVCTCPTQISYSWKLISYYCSWIRYLSSKYIISFQVVILPNVFQNLTTDIRWLESGMEKNTNNCLCKLKVSNLNDVFWLPRECWNLAPSTEYLLIIVNHNTNWMSEH